MDKFVGVAWAGTGWISVVLDGDGLTDVDVLPSFQCVWHEHRTAERMLVDIPIGLSANGRRSCDVQAKELLAPRRHTSVFWHPVRPALSAKTLSAAKDLTEAHGFSLSNQAWAIVPRIRELDTFFDLTPEAVGVVRESHPEVCFAALNDGDPMVHSKHTQDGRRERLALLARDRSDLEAVYEKAVSTFIEPPAYARRLRSDGRGDVINALVLAHTADRSAQRLGTLPSNPVIDEEPTPPRPMEIVYPSI